jgi:dTDP-4-amino-4,6-dideoxygalactose transaminase
MRQENIECGVHYIPSTCFHSIKKNIVIVRGDFPNAKSSFQCVVSLSIHPVLKDEDIDLVIEVARSILAG